MPSFPFPLYRGSSGTLRWQSLFGFLRFGLGCLRRLLLLQHLALLFLGGQGLELEGVDATFAGHFVAEEGVDHSMAGGLHLGLEDVGCDDESGGLDENMRIGRNYNGKISRERGEVRCCGPRGGERKA